MLKPLVKVEKGLEIKGATFGDLKKDQGINKGTGPPIIETLTWLEKSDKRNDEIYEGIVVDSFEDKAFGSIMGSFIGDVTAYWLEK